MTARRVVLEPMTISESELRLALDRMLEAAKERPFATVGGKITLHPPLPEELETTRPE